MPDELQRSAGSWSAVARQVDSVRGILREAGLLLLRQQAQSLFE